MVKAMKSSSPNYPLRFTFRAMASLVLTATTMAALVFVASGSGSGAHHRRLHIHQNLPAQTPGSPSSPEMETMETFTIDGAWTSFRAARGMSSLPAVAQAESRQGHSHDSDRVGEDSDLDMESRNHPMINRFDIEGRRRSQSADADVPLEQNRVQSSSSVDDAAALSQALAQLYLAADARRTETMSMGEIVASFRAIADREEKATATKAHASTSTEKVSANQVGEDRPRIITSRS